MRKSEGRHPGSHYLPIACDVYSEIEVAILHQQRLRLTWHEGNVPFETCAGAEFLHGRLPSGESARIRLDRIDRMEPA